MINRRYLDIVRLLLDHDDYITINDISKELKVSNKTIRNDLWQVDEWLKENGLSLLRKTGVGIKIEGKSEAKLDVYRSIKEKSDMNIAFSPEARKIYVGIKLIMEGTCRNFELANELYVSRATIHKDILGLIPIFKEHKIIVNRKNNNGVSVSGSEKNFRSLLSDFLYQSNGFAAFSKMVKNTDFECTGLFPFPPIDFNDDEMKEFLKVLEDANNEYIHNLLFTSLIQVLLHIFVSFIRISEGHYITLSPEFIKELDSQPFHKEAKEVTRLLSKHYHIEYPESETYYLQVFFISMQNSGINQNDEIDSAEAKRITMDLIDEWQRMLGYPFDQDFKLIEAIYNHLCPAITRFKHGIQIENHLINDIEMMYRHSFKIVKKSMHLIEERYNCIVSDEETGFFTLHLAASINRMKKPLNTLLISLESIGAVNLLFDKLITQFPEIDIKEVKDSIDIKTEDLKDIDLILTTTDLKLATSIPILTIGTLLNDQDVARLKKIVRVHYRKKNDPVDHVLDNL